MITQSFQPQLNQKNQDNILEHLSQAKTIVNQWASNHLSSLSPPSSTFSVTIDQQLNWTKHTNTVAQMQVRDESCRCIAS